MEERYWKYSWTQSHYICVLLTGLWQQLHLFTAKPFLLSNCLQHFHKFVGLPDCPDKTSLLHDILVCRRALGCCDSWLLSERASSWLRSFSSSTRHPVSSNVPCDILFLILVSERDSSDSRAQLLAHVVHGGRGRCRAPPDHPNVDSTQLSSSNDFDGAYLF
jgi:hypothetical protein